MTTGRINQVAIFPQAPNKPRETISRLKSAINQTDNENDDSKDGQARTIQKDTHTSTRDQLQRQRCNFLPNPTRPKSRQEDTATTSDHIVQNKRHSNMFPPSLACRTRVQTSFCDTTQIGKPTSRGPRANRYLFAQRNNQPTSPSRNPNGTNPRIAASQNNVGGNLIDQPPSVPSLNRKHCNLATGQTGLRGKSQPVRRYAGVS